MIIVAQSFEYTEWNDLRTENIPASEAQPQKEIIEILEKENVLHSSFPQFSSQHVRRRNMGKTGPIRFVAFKINTRKWNT